MVNLRPGNVWRGAAAANWSSSWAAGDGSKQANSQLRLSLRELAGAKGADIQWNQAPLDLGEKSQEKAKEAQINHLYRHIGQLKVERDFFVGKVRSMSRSLRQAMIDRDHQQLSLVRQCILLDVSRASVYYRPVRPGQKTWS